MSKVSDELLPCPFCGSPADPEGWSSIDRKGPACTNPKCNGSADSAEAWNLRSASTPAKAVRVRPLEWVQTFEKYAYKSGFHSEWRGEAAGFEYGVRKSWHNPDARSGYLTKPYEPYFKALSIHDDTRYGSLEEAQAAVDAYHLNRILSALEDEPQQDEGARND